MKLRRFFAAAIAAAGLGAAAFGAAQAGQAFDAVRQRGTLNCGVNVGIAGFSLPDSQGVWRGMDADLCRGVAAAMFGDPSKVRFVPLTAVQRFTALQSGEIDVLIRQTTLTMTRDTTIGLRMVTVNLYDGHGFMVRKDFGRDGAARHGRHDRLPVARHHQRAGHGRLLPRQQPALHAHPPGAHAGQRHRAAGRALRRHRHRRDAARGASAASSPSRTTS